MELKELRRLQDALSISRDPFQPRADADQHLLRFRIKVSLSQESFISYIGHSLRLCCWPVLR